MRRPLVYLLLTLAISFWGCSFILTKEVFAESPHISASLLVAMRLAVASAILVPLLAFQHKLEPIRKGDLKWFLLLVFAEPFVYHFCEASGVRYVSSSLASLIVATIPLFVPFGLYIVYRQPIKPTIILGIFLSFLGIGVTLIGGETLSGSLNGFLFLGMAVFIAVVYMLVLTKIVDHYQPITITAYQNLIGLVYYLPVVLFADHASLPLIHFTPRLLIYIFLLGACCSGFAYVFYNIGIRYLGTSRACSFYNASPAVSLIAAVAIGQEGFTWAKLIGIVLVITGVVVAQRQSDSV
ncbi:MAG: DMT family transporter [Bacteroidales bacterium]|nr:DMT family transporter [Bacteroidales bacterium]